MAERNTPHSDGELLAVGVAASTKVEAGNLVAIDGDGYLVHAADAAGLTVFGLAEETKDNSAGADGAMACLVRRKRAFLMENSATNPVTQAMVGKSVYVEDSVTVCSDGADNDVPAGTCLAVSTAGVLVEVPGDLPIPEIPEPVTPDPFPVAANQADSVATEVSGLVTDFNALLAKLRAADLMADA